MVVIQGRNDHERESTMFQLVKSLLYRGLGVCTVRRNKACVVDVVPLIPDSIGVKLFGFEYVDSSSYGSPSPLQGVSGLSVMLDVSAGFGWFLMKI